MNYSCHHYLQVVPKVLKGALHFARHMEEESVASSMEVVYAPRVSMEVPTFVLPMVVGRGVLCLAAPRVPVAEQIAVSSTAGASDATSKVVGRVLKEALISARPMVEERDVFGSMVSVRNSRGVRVASVLLTAT